MKCSDESPKGCFEAFVDAKSYERYCREKYPLEAETLFDNFDKAEKHYCRFLRDMPDLGENMMARNMLDWFTMIWKKYSRPTCDTCV